MRSIAPASVVSAKASRPVVVLMPTCMRSSAHVMASASVRGMIFARASTAALNDTAAWSGLTPSFCEQRPLPLFAMNGKIRKRSRLAPLRAGLYAFLLAVLAACCKVLGAVANGVWIQRLSAALALALCDVFV